MPDDLDFELVKAYTRSLDHHTILILKEEKGWHLFYHAVGHMFCFRFRYSILRHNAKSFELETP